MIPKPLQVSRPKLPSFERLLNYGRDLDEARFYTNFGAKHEMLRKLLAEHFGMKEDCVGLAASGSVALSALLHARAGRARAFKPLCVCASFTFSATAAVAVENGYTPYFADIDPFSWNLDPEAVKQMPLLREVGAVVVTAAMGRPIDLRAWQAFSDSTRIPVVVDAAAGFDTLDKEALKEVRLPVMISLHATKTFSTGEGGLMLCSDPDLIYRAVSTLNFGFEEDRISMRHGSNGKMSEYHAIVGLCDFETWESKREGFRHVGETYLNLGLEMGLAPRVFGESAHALPYAHFLAEDSIQAMRITNALDSNLIDWRRWYGFGIRSHPAFADYPSVALPETEQIASRLIGLPMATDMTDTDVQRTLGVIRSAISND